MKKPAYVECKDGVPIRIFRNAHDAFTFSGEAKLMPYREAVSAIRVLIWLRTKGECEWCSKIISERSMHLHEQISRGNGGEISLANSVGICYDCHFGPAGHGDRTTRFGEER